MSITEERPAPATVRPELDEVLREVNRIRTARGADPIYELRPGEPNVAWHCAVANSLHDVGCTAVYENVVFRAMPQIVKTPPLLFDFIKRFDHGEYPELIAS